MTVDASAVSVEPVRYEAEGGGAEIEGLLYRSPQSEARAPVVGIFHGGPGVRQMKSEEYLALALARAGYVVLSGTYRQPSPSAYDNEDVTGALNYLCALPYADKGRLGIGGHSRGGFASLRLAGRDPRIKSVLALAAGTGMEDADERMKSHCFSRYVELFRYGGGTVESNVRRRKGLNPSAAELERIKVPVLWVHGTRDFNTPPDAAIMAHDIVARAGNAQARIELMPDMDHFWGHPRGPMHQRIAEIAVNWFDETLRHA